MSTPLLLIEDNSGDIRLVREAFRDSRISVCIHASADGVDAMAFLNREGVHVLAPRPDIIPLDLNLPKMDGREVLRRVKSDDDLKAIPVVIRSSSEAEADIAISYELQANCYLRKPLLSDDFQNTIKSIGEFRLTKVILPKREPAGHERDRAASS
jgi:CheY-like chemotaxis protein